MAERDQLVECIARLGYRFRDQALLRQAVVHSSYAFERGGGKLQRNNERLEFLGDAVLDMAVGALLYELYPRMREGDLSRHRAALVNEAHLALMAREIGLDAFILLGRGERKSGGNTKPSILAGAFEAVVGAVYLDGGCESAQQMMRKLFLPWLEAALALKHSDAKSTLQELLQERYGEAPAYHLEGEEGPAHDRIFSSVVIFRGEIMGRGKAGSKKEAEQAAAAAALAKM